MQHGLQHWLLQEGRWDTALPPRHRLSPMGNSRAKASGTCSTALAVHRGALHGASLSPLQVAVFSITERTVDGLCDAAPWVDRTQSHGPQRPCLDQLHIGPHERPYH